MADTVKVQTIVDTSHRTSVLLTNLSDATGEADVLKVNAAALVGAFRTLTTVANVTNGYFKIGEVITANTSGATGVVADQEQLSNGSLQLKVVSCSGTFATGEALTGSDSNTTQVQSGAQSIPSYRFTLSRIVYSVVNGAAVLTWHGTGGGANNRVAWNCSDSSDIVFSEIGGALPNDANSATGNLTLTTRAFNANSSYSIFMNLQKMSGYTAVLKEKNPKWGYGNSF
jgi:hypothetical protein